MSLEITLICDRCGALMVGVSKHAPKAGAMVRAEARGFGARTGLPGGMDYCRDCWSQMKIEPWPPSAQRSAEGAPKGDDRA